LCCLARTSRIRWCSAERLSDSRPHVALVMWFTERWSASVTEAFAEMRPIAPMLASAGRGIAFSTDAARRARPLIEEIPNAPPASRLARLMEVLTLLSADNDWTSIAGAAADRRQVASPDQARIERVLDHIHAYYREPIGIAVLAKVAALSASGFHRLFRRHTQLTVGDYIAELRVGHACALLVTPIARSRISPTRWVTGALPTSTGNSAR
jgi:AraC-like DNA-binding protein